MKNTLSSFTRDQQQAVMGLYVAAALLLLTFLLLQRFSRPPVPLLVPKLLDFPLQIDSWQGTESTIGQDIVTALKLDDYTLRAYQQTSGDPVWLYIGYYATRSGFSKHHSPLVCYPGSGWQILEKGLQTIELPNLKPIRVQKLLVQKGLQKRVVLYWHQWGDEVTLDQFSWLDYGSQIFTEYKFKVYSALQSTPLRSDKALVRIDAPVTQTIDKTLANEIAFVQAAFPLLSKHFALHEDPR